MYCSESDIYDHGIARGSTPNPGRVIESAIDGLCTLDVHGFADNQLVTLRPAGDGDMPVGLTAGTGYFVYFESESTFRLRSVADGAALDFDAVDPLVVVTPLPVAAAIAWASQMIDDMIPAHAVPIEGNVPPIVAFTCAELAAGKLLAVMGASSVSLAETVDNARKRLERWGKGVPLPGAAEDNPARTNLAAVATATCPDTRGWRRFGGL